MTEQNYPENKSNIFSNSFENAAKTSIKKVLTICRRVLFSCLALLIVLSCTSLVIAQNNQSTNDSDWIGNYYFSENASVAKRRNPQDVVPSASYEITIKEKNDELMALFSANGVQLFEAYECSIIVKNNTLEFYFQNLGSADIQSFRKFKKDDLLFSLTKIENGKTAKYLFNPAAYKIIRVSSSKQNTRVYFEKPQN